MKGNRKNKPQAHELGFKRIPSPMTYYSNFNKSIGDFPEQHQPEFPEIFTWNQKLLTFTPFQNEKLFDENMKVRSMKRKQQFQQEDVAQDFFLTSQQKNEKMMFNKTEQLMKAIKKQNKNAPQDYKKKITEIKKNKELIDFIDQDQRKQFSSTKSQMEEISRQKQQGGTISKEALDRKGLALRIVLSSIPMDKLQKLLFQKQQHMKQTIQKLNPINSKFRMEKQIVPIFNQYSQVLPYVTNDFRSKIEQSMTRDKHKTNDHFYTTDKSKIMQTQQSQLQKSGSHKNFQQSSQRLQKQTQQNTEQYIQQMKNKQINNTNQYLVNLETNQSYTQDQQTDKKSKNRPNNNQVDTMQSMTEYTSVNNLQNNSQKNLEIQQKQNKQFRIVQNQVEFRKTLQNTSQKNPFLNQIPEWKQKQLQLQKQKNAKIQQQQIQRQQSNVNLHNSNKHLININHQHQNQNQNNLNLNEQQLAQIPFNAMVDNLDKYLDNEDLKKLNILRELYQTDDDKNFYNYNKYYYENYSKKNKGILMNLSIQTTEKNKNFSNKVQNYIQEVKEEMLPADYFDKYKQNSENDINSQEPYNSENDQNNKMGQNDKKQSSFGNLQNLQQQNSQQSQGQGKFVVKDDLNKNNLNIKISDQDQLVNNQQLEFQQQQQQQQLSQDDNSPLRIKNLSKIEENNISIQDDVLSSEIQ